VKAMKVTGIICLSGLMFLANMAYSASFVKSDVIVYPAPAGEKLSDAYAVSVSGKQSPVYIARVSSRNRLTRKTTSETSDAANTFENAAFTYFDMQGEARVTVTIPGEITSAKIFPTSAGIKPEINQHSLSFIIHKAQNLTVEVNGEYVQSLHIFANPLQIHIPRADDPNVVFFGPGIHQLTHLDIGDNKTVYLAGGAIIRAVIDSNEHYTVNSGDKLRNYSPIFSIRGKNITFRGRGIIDASACPVHSRNIIWARGSNIKFEGVILRDASSWNMPIRQSDNVTVDNIKIIGYRANSDGIDICNSRNVLVKNCFIRTFDDLIVVKADKGQGEAKGIVARNCVLWNELAHALSIGAEIRDPVDDVLFTNCDVIHDHGREWSLRVFQCDSAVVSDVRFENIRIEEAHRLISLWIGKAVWSRDKDYGHIQDVSFKNITATGSPLTVELTGADEQHLVQSVTFNNVVVNGKSIGNQDVKANGFVKNITVIP
jgi:hypothetical protein